MATERNLVGSRSTTARSRQVFTYLTGQYDNLGDALLRRAMLAALADSGIWHVYVGDAPDDYVASLQLPPATTTYRSARRWVRAAARGMSGRGRGLLVTNPGEISSTRIELGLGSCSAALSTLGRVAGNPAVRVGIGARDRRRPYSLGHEAAVALASVNVWRDATSLDMYGRGQVAPDWAFALPAYRATPSSERDLVSLSYRGDRPLPDIETLRRVKKWSESKGLELVVVTQVRRDHASSQDVAEALGIRHIGRLEAELDATEQLARDAYSRSILVLSNRIHALIVGMVDGAAPCPVIAHPDVKVGRTLRAAGWSFDSFDALDGTTDLADYLDQAAESRSQLEPVLTAARRRLDEVAAVVSGLAQ